LILLGYLLALTVRNLLFGVAKRRYLTDYDRFIGDYVGDCKC